MISKLLLNLKAKENERFENIKCQIFCLKKITNKIKRKWRNTIVNKVLIKISKKILSPNRLMNQVYEKIVFHEKTQIIMKYLKKYNFSKEIKM